MLHTDIPTRDDVDTLATVRKHPCVSIYLSTSPLPQESEKARMELKNRLTEAVQQLRDAGTDKGPIEELQETLDDLIQDSDFWRSLSYSLAIFATPDSVRTFRLPNRLGGALEVSDRFYLKPLLRAVTFPQAAFVLALAQNSVRLLEISAESPVYAVSVPGLPSDVADAVGLPSINGRTQDSHIMGGRIQGAEGQKVRMRQYARAIDRALRPVLSGVDLPLTLAAAEPLAGIYRSVNSYPNLTEAIIPGNPEETPDEELGRAARGILDELYAAELDGLKDRMARRAAHGRAVTDLSDVARAATYGAVDTLFVDIDQSVPGLVDEETGAVTLSAEDDAITYGVVDEILRRALLSGAEIFAVRADDMPGGGAVAAGVRFMV
ncbi:MULTISPECIES: hypothetical protein [unclassified Cryobacterium]|uniref:baeRF11 domain-containing protein n=1 Tax=unclassified Cryobacterium TaxID=2649013 RepID=UPI00106B6B6F|nr:MULTISPECIES: hypothetical protein [unclassified Cryobacterium]TFC51601.1 hypothetical protein E3O68_15430 [Cryobacterium sp. TMB3-1-2]TFC66102.1 hypothetical protein E3T21_18840 [Cryobacterium sp. TMB3-15]TFC78615.1 hypothetical protein E3T22_03920 [Cryobacterium sp. TMB3-10]TFD40301.1 hypothetical protein E3T58_13790 [Cryobacterium sp. TMB3-12]